MSAGLVQLDPRIRSPIKIKPFRECLIQKCVRHFDINKVGDDTHLSFFEMAGAFEVGDFNDIKTISNIWNFLIKNLRIDSNKIWVTAFNKEIIYDKKIELPENFKKFLFKIAGKHLIYGDKNTNFWTQGGGAEFSDNIKLCGPQVEFFYDRGINKKCKNKNCNPLCPCGRFMEISNILLIKYFFNRGGSLTISDLLNPATEAVIGIERCTQITEKVGDIYQTKLFSPLINFFKDQGLNREIKTIVDHSKALCFILAEEKILPAKNERGRIIRTLVRKLLSSFYILDLRVENYLPKLINKISSMYKISYPEIKKCKTNVLGITYNHEKIYKKTLNNGLKELSKLECVNSNIDKGTFYWEKYGLPPGLFYKAVRNKGMVIL